MDPLAEKYYQLSPYNYVANNPLKFIDLDGEKIVDANGNVMYTEQGGWTKYATEDAKLIGNSMRLTNIGFEKLNVLANASYSVTLEMNRNNVNHNNLGNMVPSYDHNGNMISAKIVVFESNLKSHMEEIKNVKEIKENNPAAKIVGGEKVNALIENTPSQEQRIGQVAVHEAIHGTDKNAQAKFNSDKFQREALADEKEIQAIKETPVRIEPRPAVLK